MTGQARYAARATTYKGVRMRSRLEATAAALLDQMRIEWAYEPECFADDRGQYLPDFKLWPNGHPGLDQSWWLEIKPTFFYEAWPVEPRTELSEALEKMEIVRSSDPSAALSLWMPNPDLRSGGRLLVHSPLWARKTGWNSVPALDYLARPRAAADPAEFYAASSRRPAPNRGLFVDDRRADPWAAS